MHSEQTIVVINNGPVVIKHLNGNFIFSQRGGWVCPSLKSNDWLCQAFDNRASNTYIVCRIAMPDGIEDNELNRKTLKQKLYKECNVIAVFIEKELYDAFYLRANSDLWPLFHDMPNWVNAYVSNKEYTKGVHQYAVVNNIYAKTVIQHIKEHHDRSFRILTNDYQLIHTHGLICQALKKTPSLCTSYRAQYFHHIPCGLAFKRAPDAKNLTQSLSQDGSEVYFHSNEFASNFRAICEHYNFTPPKIGVNPIGVKYSDHANIDVKTHGINNLLKYLTTKGFKEEIYTLNSLLQLYADNPNIPLTYSCSRLDYTKGIPELLEAIELILKRSLGNKSSPMFYGAFIIHCPPTRGSVGKYKELSESCIATIKRINKTYANNVHGGCPIYFFNVPFQKEHMHVLQHFCKIGIMNSKQDGYNLTAAEYIANQSLPPYKETVQLQGKPVTIKIKPGVCDVLMGKNTGIYHLFRHNIFVGITPENIPDFANKIIDAMRNVVQIGPSALKTSTWIKTNWIKWVCDITEWGTTFKQSYSPTPINYLLRGMDKARAASETIKQRRHKRQDIMPHVVTTPKTPPNKSWLNSNYSDMSISPHRRPTDIGK